jgi:hypothetical protein
MQPVKSNVFATRLSREAQAGKFADRCVDALRYAPCTTRVSYSPSTWSSLLVINILPSIISNSHFWCDRSLIVVPSVNDATSIVDSCHKSSSAKTFNYD